MVVSLALWLDQLWNGQIAHLATLAYVYKPVFIIVITVGAYLPITHILLFTTSKQLLVPWLMTVFGTTAKHNIAQLILH